MTKRTKLLQFPKATMLKIAERDQICIFCKLGYHMDSHNAFDYQIHDIMHFIGKGQGGLGIEQNGALGCRYHHSLYDNGNQGLHDEMKEIFKEHLKSLYPGWDEDKLVYKKY